METLISVNNPKSPISEAYRMLRTNIQFSSYDRLLKVINITSTGPGEGKTTTICNLAVTMAQSGKKVLLIDADLRKPQLHRQFNVKNSRGLTNVLVQHVKTDDVIVATEQRGLDILTTGPIPPNPSELIGSKRMMDIIEVVTMKYDHILIDCPPVGVVTDPALLSAIVDGTIFVVSYGKTSIEESKRAKSLLDNVNANILGVVLNKIPKDGKGYYGYYQYYGDDDNMVTSESK